MLNIKEKTEKINTIHESIINGQRDQAFELIIEYGRGFFFDYRDYMKSHAFSHLIQKDLLDAFYLFVERIEEWK